MEREGLIMTQRVCHLYDKKDRHHDENIANASRTKSSACYRYLQTDCYYQISCRKTLVSWERKSVHGEPPMGRLSLGRRLVFQTSVTLHSQSLPDTCCLSKSVLDKRVTNVILGRRAARGDDTTWPQSGNATCKKSL
jgi:hypothetical protein